MGGDNKIAKSNLSADASNSYHIPVMLQEAVEGLQINPSGTYVDCTFGGGGHSREILKRLGKDGKLFVFDQDAEAKRNIPDDERLVFIPQNFRYLQKFLRLHKCVEVDGILADLGVSSHQFDEPERGFSIRFDAALDMRMDNRQTLTAADVIATYSEQQLQKIFEVYGEVTNAKTLARTIVEQKNVSAIKTIGQFKQAISQIVKGNPNKYLAQVFQALRIEVNDEIGALEDMLQQSLEVLKPGGRIAVITFHSLEDRVVKNFFKKDVSGSNSADVIFGSKKQQAFEVIYKKPVTASAGEIKSNPRSRSAKLRVAEKI